MYEYCLIFFHLELFHFCCIFYNWYPSFFTIWVPWCISEKSTFFMLYMKTIFWKGELLNWDSLLKNLKKLLHLLDEVPTSLHRVPACLEEGNSTQFAVALFCTCGGIRRTCVLCWGVATGVKVQLLAPNGGWSYVSFREVPPVALWRMTVGAGETEWGRYLSIAVQVQDEKCESWTWIVVVGHRGECGLEKCKFPDVTIDLT